MLFQSELPESSYRLALEASGLGAFERRLDTDEVLWSAGMWDITGLSPRPRVVIDDFFALVHPEDRARLGRSTSQLIEGIERGPFEQDFRMVRPDGTVRHIRAHVAFERGDTGARLFGVLADVTAQHEAAAAQKRRETRYRLTVTASNMGLFEAQVIEGRLEGRVYWSPRIWQIVGREPTGDGTVAAVTDHIHPADRAVARDAINAAIAASVPVGTNYDVRYLRPDGTIRYAHVDLIGETAENGTLRCLHGVVSDRTEAHVADQERQQRSARYQLAIEATNFGLFEFTVATGRIDWSPRLWQIAGRPPTPDNTLDLPTFLGCLHPGDRAVIQQTVSLSRTGISLGHAHILRFLRPDGSLRHCQINTISERYDSGTILRLHGVVADITEQQETQRRLQDSETQNRLGIAIVNLGVFTRDLAAGRATWSARQWEIFGLAPRPHPPAEPEMAAMIHPDDISRASAARSAVLSGQAETVEDVEYRIIRPDGAIRQLVTKVARQYDDRGTAVSLIGVTADITDQRDLLAKTQSAGNLATLGQMATGIAHEFGQPLQVIGTQAAIAAHYIEPLATSAAIAAQKALATIENQAERLGNTMRHLLAFGRGPAAVVPGAPTAACTIGAAIEGALDLIGRSLANDGIKIAVHCALDRVRIPIALLDLERVLINLLLNARDAMETATQRDVRILVSESGGDILLDVEDSGGGIPDHVIRQIFDPFFTTKPVGKGTGLGLSLCRATIEASGGHITAENIPGGARFRVRLPRIEPT